MPAASNRLAARANTLAMFLRCCTYLELSQGGDFEQSGSSDLSNRISTDIQPLQMVAVGYDLEYTIIGHRVADKAELLQSLLTDCDLIDVAVLDPGPVYISWKATKM